MSATLSKRARQFQAFPDERGTGLTVLELPGSTRTAEDPARALGCSTAQIVKALVFRDLVTDAPVMVLASGPNRVDEKIIAEHLGHKMDKADADYVKAAGGAHLDPGRAHRDLREMMAGPRQSRGCPPAGRLDAALRACARSASQRPTW